MSVSTVQPRKQSLRQSRKTAVFTLILFSAVLVVAVLVAWRMGLIGHDGSLDSETAVTEMSAGSAAEGAGTARPDGEGAAGETDAALPSRLSTEPLPSIGLVVPGTATGATCPVPFPSGCGAIDYSQGSATESWKTVSVQDCRDAARELLLALQADGFELVKAGYSDLAGEAWSCAAKSGEDEAFVISLLPQHLGSPRGSSNQLVVTVVRIGAPDSTLVKGSEQ
ncbi:MAG: hypothetical protein LBU31_02125 [Coriobacteriales bacterium]|nr:hypothetical protein [Coriobacteriales bacterium]